jgi:uncharacterized protein involved in outer membrane biogenesis
VKFLSDKRVWAAALVLLALFLVRPGVSRLKSRITVSLSRAVGRPADIGSVHLRFLPQPGFDLDNLVIFEDPAFGSEPMLRAREVTAVVRLTSLLRGRLDIARLELTEPSLNLVRSADGRWNWRDLLQRAAQAPLAPTAKPKSEPRRGFPYIEATSGRINFKTGQEKKPYALLNADFSVWQESENTWGMRLQAEPLRTDMSMSDTGLLRLNGTWQRASNLRDTPLQFSAEWDHAQLGQITKLSLGDDKGWRGDVRLDATLSGTPGAMQVAFDSSIQDFHRYDISRVEGLRLAAHCEGRYSSAEGVMHEILCRAPVGNGLVTLQGDAGLPGVRKIDLVLNMDRVPVASVTALARRAKKNLPADLLSTGTMQGTFTVNENQKSPAEYAGRGEITNFQLRSANTNVEFATATIPFSLAPGATDSGIHSATRSTSAEILPLANELHIQYGPFPVALGRPAPALVRGWISRSGYAIALDGDGEVSHVLRLAGLLGVPAIQSTAEGTAQMQLQLRGSWVATSSAPAAFQSPAVIGNVQLQNLRARLRGVNAPVEISSAQLRLLPDEARIEKLKAKAAGTLWTGTVSLPRGCGVPGACTVHFDLNADELALADVAECLGSKRDTRHWYQILSPDSARPTFLQDVMASGKLNTAQLKIHGVTAQRVLASVDLTKGKLKISDLRADVFGGKYRGEWHADFAGDAAPVYAGTGAFNSISLQQVASAMHEPWISGTASGTYQLSASGAEAGAFWQSAEGDLQFDIRDGSLPHILLTSDDQLRIIRWQGQTELRAGKLEIEKSKLVSPSEVFEISGTASLTRSLDLKLAQTTASGTAHAAPPVYSIKGTLSDPQVELNAPPETQAKLKP